MEQVRFAKGDIVCRKKKFSKEYIRVTSAKGKMLTGYYLGKNSLDKDWIMFSKKEAYKYNIGTITVQPQVLERLVAGQTDVVYGPMLPSWKKICVSMIQPVPDVIKINNAWKGWAIFQYVEAARVYVGEHIQVRLQVGQLLEQFDV